MKTFAAWAVSLLAIAVPVIVSYDLYSRGPSAGKYLERRIDTPVNLLRMFADSADSARPRLTINGRELDDPMMVQVSLRNTGRTPILRSDYAGKMSLSVRGPWTIVSINRRPAEDGVETSDIPARWKRVNETRFEAEGELLNPGDSIAAILCLAISRSSKNLRAFGAPRGIVAPDVRWDVRAANVRVYSVGQGVEAFELQRLGIGIHGWGFVCAVGTGAVVLLLYLWLLARAQLLPAWSLATALLIVAACGFSVVSAWAVAEYWFPEVRLSGLAASSPEGVKTAMQ